MGKNYWLLLQKLDRCFKNCIQKVVHKTVGATGELIGNTIRLYQSLQQKKWIEVNHLSNGQYFIYKNIRFKTPMLREDLWDYSDEYIAVKGTLDLGVVENNATT